MSMRCRCSELESDPDRNNKHMMTRIRFLMPYRCPFSCSMTRIRILKPYRCPFSYSMTRGRILTPYRCAFSYDAAPDSDALVPSGALVLVPKNVCGSGGFGRR